MELITIIDTETTGLNPKSDKTIEIGALLYSVSHKVVLQTLSFFLPCEVNPVENINNIKVDWTKCYNVTNNLFNSLSDMVEASSLVVAHNAKFDKRFMHEIKEIPLSFWRTPWMCTKNHFDWPVNLPRKRLQDICQALHIPYLDAHRALTDCHFLAQCFDRVENLKEKLELSARKSIAT